MSKIPASGKTRCSCAAGRDRSGSGPCRSAITRRRFLRDGAISVAGALAAQHLLGSARADGRRSRIVRAFHSGATTGMSDVHPWPVNLMVQTAIRELTGINETSAAWKSLFPGIDATKRVAIKINLACGDVPTHPEVIDAVIDGLLMMDLGGAHLPPENIVVWDADNAFFCPQTGYTVNYGGPGVQYYGTDHAGVGYDYSRIFTIQHPHGSNTNHSPSSIITQRCDYLINAGVLKDHSDSGVTFCLKNHYGSFSNIAIVQTHTHGYYGDGHARTQPELSRILRDQLGDKTKLWLLDGTLGLYNGGPGYTPPWHTPPNWAYNSVLVGLDVAAVDRIGTIKINEERARHSLPALDPTPIRAASGAPFYLGTDDPSQIDLIERDLSAQQAPELAAGPRAVSLMPPYPNPSRGPATLRFQCAALTDLELVIVDASGVVVRTLRSGPCPAGVHRVSWDGRDISGRQVPSGAFFCRLRSGRGEASEKLIILH